ncbi:MAG: hypothetical protein PHV11_00285 [Candidatus Bipolaricaulis sp.]|nr:hypothetical protein [Candidatus Bipolaricaulis sp.]
MAKPAQTEKLDNLIIDVQTLRVGLAELKVSVGYLNKFMWAVLGATVVNLLESSFKIVSNHLTHFIIGGMRMYGNPVEFFGWLAGGGAVLGIVASFLVQVIKKLQPSVTDKTAKYVSILVAVAISIGAKYLLPYVGSLPEDVVALWPFIVYIAEQIVFDWLHNAGVDNMGFGVWRRVG